MGVLKWVGYTLASILALTVLLAGGVLVAALVFGGSVILFIGTAVVFIAYCIKEYCEPVSDRSHSGERRSP